MICVVFVMDGWDFCLGRRGSAGKRLPFLFLFQSSSHRNVERSFVYFGELRASIYITDIICYT